MRALKKSKTPEFQRQESWRYVRIHDPWRKPKGVDSHMRLSVKGWPALVKIGYRGPREARGLHPSGYRDVLVHNKIELELLSKDYDAARLAATVGRRKKIELAIRARELGIRVLNGRGLLPSEVKSPQGEEKEKEEEEKPVMTGKEEAAPETGTSAQSSEEQSQQEGEQPIEETTPVSETEQHEITSTPEEPSGVVVTEEKTEQQEETEAEPTEKSKPKKVSKAAKKKSAKKSATKKASKAKSKKKQSKKKKSKEK